MKVWAFLKLRASGDLDAVPAHAILVDIDAKTRPAETFDVAVGGRHRLAGDVFAETRVRQGQAPGDVRNDRCDMQRRGAGHARLAGFARNVHAHAEAVAQPAGRYDAANAAELDRLQADAARRLAVVMPLDVVEAVDAFVGADGDLGGRGLCRRHAVEIVRLDRLFEEIEAAALSTART